MKPLYDFVVFTLFFACIPSSLTQPSCPHDQSIALIRFNNSFSIDCSSKTYGCNARMGKTISWKEGTDCCLWDGVTCDTDTGNVIGLDLSCGCLVGPISSNSSLFFLRHLRRLNLARNHFDWSLMPSQFGQLTGLTHLNISDSEFGGNIPLEISHLHKLLSLDLSYNSVMTFQGDVFANVMRNLTQLRHLVLPYIHMDFVEPTSFLNMSSHITTFILGYTGLQGRFPEDVFHFPYLQTFSVEGEHELELKFPETNWSSPLKSLHVSSNLQELPESIGNLRSLETLDLSLSKLRGPIPAALANLTRLEYLDLSGNDLGGLFPFSVFEFTQVQFRDFSFNNLVGSLPSQVTGLSRLRSLKLDDNFLSGRVPSWLFSLPSLIELGLSNNKLTGSIDRIDKVAPLQVVDLGSNKIEGPVPGFVYQLVNLTLLDLSSNKLNGSFDLDKLSKHTKLKKLSLSNNDLLVLSTASYSLHGLEDLYLSSCNITEFPKFVRNVEGLISLNLSHNRIRVIESHMFEKLKKLEELDLSHNSPLYLKNDSNLTLVLPGLTDLLLSSCNITEFSNFLTTQESLGALDLSNNSIQGRITEQERNWGRNLEYLDLSNNLLTGAECYPWKKIEKLNLRSNLLEGPLLPPPPSVSAFLVSNNRLTGEIPSSICNCSLATIDLSNNNLSGAIPECLFSSQTMEYLEVLDLHTNNFHGKIPDTFSDHEDGGLETLNLNNNHFDGPLPKSLADCSCLQVLNLGNNKLNDTFPHWLGDLPQLQVLVLRSNNFHGQIIPAENRSHFSTLRILDLSHNEFSGFLPTTYFTSFKNMMNSTQLQMEYDVDSHYYYQDSIVVTMKSVDIEMDRILTIFATIDMSSNKFEGTIPDIVGNLVSLQVLNFSHNHLTGRIPSSLGNLAALESLDLSSNKLAGKIPSQLTALNFLEVLNLSNNQLVGLIPQGKQFNTFLNDSYVGNPGLCGFPVSKSCGHGPPPAPAFDEQEDDSSFGLDWKFVMMGYGCGLVFGYSAGYIVMTTGKPKWLVSMVQRAGSQVLRRFKKYG